MSHCRDILENQYDGNSMLETFHIDIIVLLRFISTIILLGIVVKNKQRASREDGRQASLLILPSYYAYIFVLIIYFLFFGLMNIFIAGYNTIIYLMSLDIGINHSLSEGLAFFFLQHGAGTYSFQRSILFGVIFGIAAFFVFFLILTTGNNNGNDLDLNKKTYFAHTLFSAIIISFYSIILLVPDKYIYRRPAFYPYAIFSIFESIAWMISALLIYLEIKEGFCVLLSCKIIFVGVLHPVFAVYSLAKDSEVIFYFNSSSKILFAL
jgi:uncharacterized membrane protein YiaA